MKIRLFIIFILLFWRDVKHHKNFSSKLIEGTEVFNRKSLK